MIHNIENEPKFNFKGQSNKPWHITRCYLISDSKNSYWYEKRIYNFIDYKDALNFIKSHTNDNIYAWHDLSAGLHLDVNVYSNEYIKTHTQLYRKSHNIVN